MAKGQVYKIHSDFYYVKIQEEIFECKRREILKKQQQEILVGDFVEIQDNVIVEIYERKNFIRRPRVANIDLLLIVSAIKEPELDFVQLNRYITFAKIHNIDVVLCFNKDDLSDDFKLKKEIESIYKPLGYKIFVTSAINRVGISELKKELKEKNVVLCGQSGVGKSSIINALNPQNQMRVGEVSLKTLRGTHTTRHIEIVDFDDFRITDTPGFSNLRFDFILPYELDRYFEDIAQYKKFCKFSDCLHKNNDSTCGVIQNIDKIHKTRYESYIEFLGETFEYKKKLSECGAKKESTKKTNFGKNFVKIDIKKRESSRKTRKQGIKNEQL